MINRTTARKRVALTVVALIVLAGLAYGGWRWYDAREASEPAQSVEEQQSGNDSTKEEQQVGGEDVPEATSTESFSSSSPELELTHPSLWTVEEDDDDGIHLTSPDFTFETVDGREVEGYFDIYIRQGARDQDSRYLGRGIAAQPSERLTYDDPPEGQRTETNLSFFGLDNPDNFAYFFVAGNFDLERGESLGSDYGQEESTYLISGGYASDELEDDMATHTVPLDYFDQTNAYQQAIDIIESLRLL